MTTCIDSQTVFSLATMHRDVDFENRDSIMFHHNNGTSPIVYDRKSFMDRLLASEENNIIGQVYQLPSGIYIRCNGDLSQLLEPYANFFVADIKTIDGQMYGTLCCYTAEQIVSSNVDPALRLTVCDEASVLPEELEQFYSLPHYPFDGTIEEQDAFIQECKLTAQKEEGLLPLLNSYSSFPASDLKYTTIEQCLQFQYFVAPDKDIIIVVLFYNNEILIHARDQVYEINLFGETTLEFLLERIRCKYSVIRNASDDLDFSTYDTKQAFDARKKLLETPLSDFNGHSIYMYTAEYLDAQL